MRRATPLSIRHAALNADGRAREMLGAPLFGTVVLGDLVQPCGFERVEFTPAFRKRGKHDEHMFVL